MYIPENRPNFLQLRVLEGKCDETVSPIAAIRGLQWRKIIMANSDFKELNDTAQSIFRVRYVKRCILELDCDMCCYRYTSTAQSTAHSVRIYNAGPVCKS